MLQDRAQFEGVTVLNGMQANLLDEQSPLLPLGERTDTDFGRMPCKKSKIILKYLTRLVYQDYTEMAQREGEDVKNL